MGSEGARLRDERDRAKMEADRILRRILDEIAGNLAGTTVVVIFPYALQSDACEEILTALRDTWAEQGFAVKREEQVRVEMELNREAVDLMFWERRLPQHDVLLDTVTQGMSLVLMLEREGESPGEEEAEEDDALGAGLEAEHIIAKSIYGFLPGTGSSMELITPVEDEGETPAEEPSLLEELLEDDEGVEEKQEEESDKEEETGEGEEGEVDQEKEDQEQEEEEDEGLGQEEEDQEEEDEEERGEDDGEDEGMDDGAGTVPRVGRVGRYVER
ncbi:hypothetical protein FOCC_FOCC012163 [Frankliniella occidentalis]|nr:hypothetical protein FOCC_FOCC012163 [Frankliniella occidentalis]